MTKSPTALERARELVAAYYDARMVPSIGESIRAGNNDDDSAVRCTLAALTSADAERDAVIEEIAKLAEARFSGDWGWQMRKFAADLRAMKTGGE